MRVLRDRPGDRERALDQPGETRRREIAGGDDRLASADEHAQAEIGAFGALDVLELAEPPGRRLAAALDQHGIGGIGAGLLARASRSLRKSTVLSALIIANLTAKRARPRLDRLATRQMHLYRRRYHKPRKAGSAGFSPTPRNTSGKAAGTEPTSASCGLRLAGLIRTPRHVLAVSREIVIRPRGRAPRRDKRASPAALTSVRLCGRTDCRPSVAKKLLLSACNYTNG